MRFKREYYEADLEYKEKEIIINKKYNVMMHDIEYILINAPVNNRILTWSAWLFALFFLAWVIGDTPPTMFFILALVLWPLAIIDQLRNRKWFLVYFIEYNDEISVDGRRRYCLLLTDNYEQAKHLQEEVRRKFFLQDFHPKVNGSGKLGTESGKWVVRPPSTK